MLVTKSKRYMKDGNPVMILELIVPVETEVEIDGKSSKAKHIKDGHNLTAIFENPTVEEHGRLKW